MVHIHHNTTPQQVETMLIINENQKIITGTATIKDIKKYGLITASTKDKQVIIQ
jgi:hypothetical protein